MTRVCLSVLLKISPFDWIRFVEFYCDWLQNNVADSENTNNDLSLFFGWLYSGPVIKTRQNVFIFVKATHRVLIQLLWMFPNQRWWNRFCAYRSLLLPVACCLLHLICLTAVLITNLLYWAFYFWILINWSIFFSYNIWPPNVSEGHKLSLRVTSESI